MSDILDFFNKVKIKSKFEDKSQFARQITINTDKTKILNLTKYKIAVFGVFDESNNYSEKVREYLYHLYFHFKVKVVDLGNLKLGNSQNDIIYGVREVINILKENNILSIIFSNFNYIPFGVYLKFEGEKAPCNIVHVDKTINLKKEKNNFISKVILQNNNTLFNFSLLGYQTYLTPPEELNILSKLFFDNVRLGLLQSNIIETEPFFRDADIASFNIKALKSENNNEIENSPNGLTAKELCQLSRFSGISDRLSSVCFYGESYCNIEAMIVAQSIWYCIEGYSQRKSEIIKNNSKNYLKFRVKIDSQYEITFYKSKITDRWWMEVPYPKSKFEKFLIVACTYSDYYNATKKNVPDRWWKFFQKIC